MSPSVRLLLRPAAAAFPLLLASCAHQAAPPLPPQPAAQVSKPQTVVAKPSVVAVGDVLDVYVLEDASLNGQFQVHESGNIVLPRIGRIHVAGATLGGAQDMVRTRVQSDQIKTATVIVERSRTSEQVSVNEMPKLQVFISGAVNRPGQHCIPVTAQGTLSAFEALMTAGGASVFADQRKSYILRKDASGDRVRLPVDLQGVSRGEVRDVPVQDGDVIVIPQRRFGL